MKLPNGPEAFVDPTKIRDYCLSSQHPRGRHKARVFEATLNLTADNTDVLIAALLKAAVEEDVVQGEVDGFGQRYLIDFEMEFDGRCARVRSAWIVRTGENFPRLTSCFIL